MPTVLRWGQSAYETDADLAMEHAAARRLGLDWRVIPEDVDPDLDGVDVLVVTSRVRVDRALLDRFPGSLVLTTTSGWDHIDVAAASARGATVARCPIARRDAVAEQAVGGILTLLRRQPSLERAAREGRWARGELPALDPLTVSGATVLIVGLGVIGRRSAELLTGLGAEVLGVDPAGVPEGVRPVVLDEALPRIHAVTLHCALTPSTRGLFCADRIRRIAPGGVLVNTARGKLVDVDAAVDAVRAGQLRGCLIDVFPEEPWPLLRAAAEVDGVLLTPHASGYSRGLGSRVAAEVADALTAWVHREPIPTRSAG